MRASRRMRARRRAPPRHHACELRSPRLQMSTMRTATASKAPPTFTMPIGVRPHRRRRRSAAATKRQRAAAATAPAARSRHLARRHASQLVTSLDSVCTPLGSRLLTRNFLGSSPPRNAYAAQQNFSALFHSSLGASDGLYVEQKLSYA